MEDRALETIDIEKDLEDFDQFDEMLSEGGSAQVAARARHSGRIELVLVSIANALWAIVGLILWLPQAVRAVLGATLRMVHAALTQQSSERAIASIRAVSRFYVERFLDRTGSSATVARRHELRPFRLLLEVAWAVAFYLLLLRWWSPATFAPVWARLVELGESAKEGTRSVWVGLADFVTVDLAALEPSRLQVGGVLALAVALGTLVGVWIGRRR